MESITLLATLSIRACALFLCGAILAAALRGKSAATRHALWSAVLFSLLLLPALHPLLPPLPLRILPAAPVVAPVPLPLSMPPAGVAIPVERFHWPSWETYAVALYVLGVIWLLMRLAAGYRFTRAVVANASLVDIASAVSLLESDGISVPMTTGWLRPSILLPSTWREWPAAKLHSVLAHEQAHIRRHDWFIAFCARLLRTVFWFHPLAWWLERRLAALAEQACDDEALLTVADRGAYAQALVEVAADFRSADGRFLTTAMAQTSQIRHRIDAILDESRSIPAPLRRRAVAVLGAASLLSAVLAASLQLASAQAPVTAPGPYGKWLTEDVAYIINDAEREAFLRLQTTEERENFIVQFWLRRTDKEEHYRRIRYANDRFKSSTLAGWRTDRGRIYILFGPPDEIESHPSGGSHEFLIKVIGPQAGPPEDTSPYEIWHWRQNNVWFGFIDRARNGDYSLVLADSHARVLLSNPKADYTEAARAAHVEGTVSLQVIVGADGAMQSAKIIKSLHPDVDRKAIESLRQWRWYPAIRNGAFVPETLELFLSFRP